MNIGIIGAGWIADKMAETLVAHPQGCQVYAIASRSLEKAQKFAQHWGIEVAYGSYEELVSDPKVDLVYIATPHSHHYEHTRLALEHGKPCLVEKAFMANVRETKEILNMAHERGIFITEAIWTRYQPARQMVKQLLEQGAIGRPRFITASLCYPMEFKERIVRPDLCGGALLDLGVYSINFARMFFDEEWQEVKSSCVKNDTGMDLIDTITVHYASGMLAQLEATACNAFSNHGVIGGDKGWIEVDNVNNPQYISLYNADRHLVSTMAVPTQVTGYEYQVFACKEALEQGRLECDEMPHAETIRVMEIMDNLRREWGIHYPMD